MPNKTKQKVGQQNERVSNLEKQIRNVENIMLYRKTRENLENPNPNNTPMFPGMINSPPLSNLERQLRELKNIQKNISFGTSVSKAPVPISQRQSNTRTNLNKAKENALRPNSNNTKYSSKKTRCNNKGVPWYRKTIPQSRDITFKVEYKKPNGSYIVRVTWQSDEYEKQQKQIIGFYTAIGTDSFIVERISENNLKTQYKISGYTQKPAPGTCYKFKVGNKVMARIRGKLKNFTNPPRQKYF